ncbi:hypothetical protein [uncultured Vibrio sp.]|uniref:hypothetical protein n=1 Tax=uncultured Vibrio sp. TaxID=114054 RepID=UPI0026134EA2|nr:hypothetical protein [uncultured Vibrio sp.]
MFEVILEIGNVVFKDYALISLPLLVLSYTKFGFNLIADAGWVVLKPVFTLIALILSPITTPLIRYRTRNMTWEQKLDYYRSKGVDVEAVLEEGNLRA